VGDSVGEAVGASVGEAVGDSVGEAVGDSLGEAVVILSEKQWVTPSDFQLVIL
jgi:hypothetical protein